jgi:hypothetical protein
MQISPQQSTGVSIAPAPRPALTPSPQGQTRPSASSTQSGMDDLFKALRAGAKFKKRPQQAPFNPPTRPSAPGSSTGAAAPAAVASAAASLDFFRCAGPPPQSSSSSWVSVTAASGGKEAKKKRHRHAREDEKELVSSSSRPAQQQPPTPQGKTKKRKKGKKGGAEQGRGTGGSSSIRDGGAVKLFKGQRGAGYEEEEEEAAKDTDSDSDADPDADEEEEEEGGKEGKHGGRSQAEEDEMRAFRKRMRIAVQGADPPPCIGSFQEMDAGAWMWEWEGLGLARPRFFFAGRSIRQCNHTHDAFLYLDFLQKQPQRSTSSACCCTTSRPRSGWSQRPSRCRACRPWPRAAISWLRHQRAPARQPLSSSRPSSALAPPRSR